MGLPKSIAEDYAFSPIKKNKRRVNKMKFQTTHFLQKPFINPSKMGEVTVYKYYVKFARVVCEMNRLVLRVICGAVL